MQDPCRVGSSMAACPGFLPSFTPRPKCHGHHIIPFLTSGRPPFGLSLSGAQHWVKQAQSDGAGAGRDGLSVQLLTDGRQPSRSLDVRLDVQLDGRTGRGGCTAVFAPVRSGRGPRISTSPSDATLGLVPKGDCHPLAASGNETTCTLFTTYCRRNSAFLGVRAPTMSDGLEGWPR